MGHENNFSVRFVELSIILDLAIRAVAMTEPSSAMSRCTATGVGCWGWRRTKQVCTSYRGTKKDVFSDAGELVRGRTITTST